MKNDYNIATTIFNSYLRISTSYKLQLFDELKLLLERIIFLIINDTKNIVPSHNEPYSSNFTIGDDKDDRRLVDWEYSGNNNRFWDLAFLSVTSKLTSTQDEFLLRTYFCDDFNHEEASSFYLFKVVVQFTLMIWTASGPKKCNAADCDDERLKRLNNEGLILTRFFKQMYESVSPRRFHFSTTLTLFYNIEYAETETSKRPALVNKTSK